MKSKGRQSAVFLDRDGVICENRDDHVKSWAEFVFIPGAIEAVSSLTRAGLKVFIATNQAAVGRGIIAKRTLDQIHSAMLDVFGGAGGRIEAILVCPHHPDDRCACRKPQPGLLLEASRVHKLELAGSFMVGDSAADLDAGRAAGCTTVLVRTGRGSSTARARDWAQPPDFIADDVVDAAIWILGARALGGTGWTEARAQQ